jgi:outer membrane protein
MSRTASALSILLFLAIAAPVAAETKIGFVELNKVTAAAPQAQASQAALRKEFSAREQGLIKAQKDIKALEDKLAKDGAVMSEAERGKLERDIVNKKRDLKRDTDEFREDANLRMNDEQGKLLTEIFKVVRAVAQEQQIDLIVTGQFVLFASPKIDISDAVIAKLKAGGGAAPAQ